MRNRDHFVSVFDAKTHISELVRQAERGRATVITRRGKPVARIVPFEHARDAFDPAAALSAFRAIRSGIRGRLDVRELIRAGRKH